MLQQKNNILRFDGYVINRTDWTLYWAEERIALKRKSFDLLLYLVDHRDRVVNKDELLEALWAGQFVEESNLTQQIFLLRKALSRHHSGRKIIETVPGRGYRFAASLQANQEPVVQPEKSALQILVDSSNEHVGAKDHEAETNIPAAFTLDTPTETPPDAPRADSSPDKSTVAPSHSIERVRHRVPSNPGLQVILSLAVAVSMLAIYFAMRWRDPTRWHISTYTQITSDGGAKAIGGTDGSRVYFTQAKSGSVEEVSVAGGLEGPVKLGIDDAWSGDVSPDGSTLLVISQAGGQGPATSLWSFTLVGGTLRHLANAVLSSAWAPDGKRIVYASADGGVFVMRRDGSDAKRIASLGGYVKSIAWSPSRDKIRFSKEGLLWEMSADGTALRKLLPGWGKSPSQWSGGWMRDGRYFFVADGQLWLLQDGAGTDSNASINPVQLTFGPIVWDQPIASRDGKKILASGRTSRGQLVRWEPKTNQFKPFLAGISAEFVVFSNDGKSVAYVSYPQGILWRANLDGSNPIQLTEPPLYPRSVRWSPDSSKIAFVNRTADDVDAIFLVAPDGSGIPQRIQPADHQAETDPSWSPDSRQIAFSTSPNVGASAKSNLCIFDFETRKANAVPHSQNLFVPRWSPDGRFLSAMTLDTVSLKLLALPSEKWTSLDTGAVAFPEWSHDGQWIYYVRWTADPAIMRVRIDAGTREKVADLKGTPYTGAYTLWMSLDPADAPMMLRDEGTDDIYALTIERK